MRTPPTPITRATDEILAIASLARRLLKETVMRTTTPAILCSLVAIGCAPIGQPGHHGQDPGPDAGTQASTCSDLVTKTMDLTLSGESSSATNLPTSCWKLAGKLTISGSASSLAKLGDLRGVSDLVIDGAPLARIDTKNPLEVTRSIDIHNTTALVDLANLAVPSDATCLSYLASVSIVGNSALTSLGGLSQLRCVSGAVTIQNNVKLATLDLGQAKRLEGGLTIQDNTVLTQVTLTALESVTGDLVIRHDPALTSLGTMPALKYLHGSVVIDNNAALVSLPTAMNTTMPIIEGSLTVTGNAKLASVGQFSHFAGVDVTINVSNNPALDFCNAREVGCCVPHNGLATIANDKTNNNCPNSWCHNDAATWAAQGNQCFGY